MIGAYKYIECSVLTNEGVKEVLEHTIRAALLIRRRAEKKPFTLLRLFGK